MNGRPEKSQPEHAPAAMPQRRRILVFAERGADPHALIQTLRDTFNGTVSVEPATADTLREPGALSPERTAAFFLPGASEANYDNKLGADNIARLRKYVEDGGSFMGICAGAYYGCEQIDWFGWDPARHKTKNPRIDFFNYLAAGPIRELLTDKRNDPALAAPLSHAAAAHITFNDSFGKIVIAPLLYWGGPRLSPLPGHPQQGTIIAHFNTASDHPPAIIFRQYGKGRVILSAVHAEISGQTISAMGAAGNSPQHERIRDIAALLTVHERERRQIWNSLMKRLLPGIPLR